MGHLWGRSWCAIFILDHTIVKLWRHGDNHMIVVWVEMSTLWNVKTEWRIVVIPSQKVVWIVDETWVVGGGLGEIGRPDSEVGVLSLMHSHVWWPHSIVNNSLSKVPFLEEVTSIFLMGWMDLWQVDHLLHEFDLGETLIHEQVILLMHSSMATLACSLEDLESSSKSSRVVGIPCTLRWPVAVTVMHTNRVNLFFITLDTVWCTDIISEEPGFTLWMSTNEWISSERRPDAIDKRTHSI
jgi:hypothetical protein